MKEIQTEDYLREIIIIFFARKRIILKVMFAVTLIALCVAFFWPSTYAVKGAVLLRGKKMAKSPEVLEKTELRMFEVTRKDLASEVQLITSNDVVVRTVEILHKKHGFFPETATATAYAETVRSLQNRIKPEIMPESNVIHISLVTAHPHQALIILNELIDQYIQYRSNIYNPNQAVSFYEQQVKHYSMALNEIEDKQVALSQEFNSPDPASEIEKNLSLHRDLEQQLEQARIEYLEKKQYLNHLKSMLAEKNLRFFSTIENPAIVQLGQKLQSQFVEQGDILRVYHPKSEKVRAMNEQITRTFNALQQEVVSYIETVHNEVDIINDKITWLQNRLCTLTARSLRLQVFLTEKQRNEREMELIRHSYDTFAIRLEEARINASSNAGNLFSISIVSKPYFSGEVLFPKKRVVIPVSILASIILGFSIGFLREYFDHTFKKPEDITKFAGLPTILSITQWKLK